MALYYIDTSALVKLYVREAGTERMVSLGDRSAGHTLILLALSQVEFRAAVRQRERLGDLPAAAAAVVLERFESHCATRFRFQPLGENVLSEALFVLDHYPLRAYDAVQLAGCLVVRASAQSQQPVFVCSDRQLLEAARKAGVAVLDPTAL